MLNAINELGRLPEASLRELEQVCSDVIRSGWFVLGPHTASFEEGFAQYCGVAHAIGVANGTDALEIALRGLGVGEGDVVLAAANAGFYGSHAILAVGATPRYVEIDEVTMTLTAETLRSADWKDVKAVIVTHLYGLMAPIAGIIELADARGVPVIEDCAQAHGAEVEGGKAGSWGRLSCFSFYPTKNLGALGDGGAIVTSDSELAARVRQLRQYGWSTKYNISLPHGRNSRLDELQAALLNIKLPYLDGANSRRRAIATQYVARIQHPQVTLPSILDERYVAHLFVVRTAARDSLRAHLNAKKIPCDVHYPIPDYRQAVFESTSYGMLSVTERACQQVLTLPCFPEMTEAEVSMVIAAVNGWNGLCTR